MYQFSRFRLLSFLLCLILLVSSLMSFETLMKAHGARQSGSLSSIHTIFFIMFENHSITDILGNPSAPFINNTLVPEASMATNAWDVPGEHPSLTAYLTLEAGSTLGVTTDNPPPQQHFSPTDHFTTQLKNAGFTWRTYAEGNSGTVCPIKSNSSTSYAAWHNATVYFDDNTGTNNLNSTYCISHERPYSQLSSDLSAGNVANHNYIEPSLGHDMHQACSTWTDPVKCADSWLSVLVPKITASAQYKAGGALFITWDEGTDNPDGSDGDGPLGIIVLSPFERAPGFVDSTTQYVHAGILHTWEEIFGLSFLRNAATATDVSNLFQ